jgi:hypothetical protein
MPYDLKKARGKDLYWVITKETGLKHSKDPLPLERAIAQMRALYANVPDARGGMMPKPPPAKVIANPMRVIEPSFQSLMKYAQGDATTKGKTLTAFVKFIQPDMEKQGATEDRISAKMKEMGWNYSTGKGLSPSDQLEISKSTYGNAKPKIGDAQLMKETKTLKFYKEGNNIIIGVRGTKDWKDWVSNFSLAVRDKSVFRATPRVTEDIAEIKEFQKQYPPSQYHYSGVGHSLGGAVVDELIDSGLIKEGRSYNPAVHLEDLHKGVDKNKRVYEEKDPLRVIGLLAGQKQGDLDVRKSTIESEDPLEHHKIGNPAFEGGGKGQSKMPISSVPPVETSTIQRNQNKYFEKKGDPFLVIYSIKPDGERSFVQFFTPEDFFKSSRWENIKLSHQYGHHKQLLLLANEWRKLNDKPEVKDEEEEGSGYTGGGTHKENFLKAHNLPDKGYSLAELSKISCVPLAILKEVAKRGYGAYNTQPSSVRLKGSYVKGVNAPMKAKLSASQWSRARVFSFLDGNPKHDNDLRKGGMMPFAEHKKKMKELREENLAKQRATSNFSPIQVPPPPPPLKSNRKIAFSLIGRTAPPVFKGEGIHGKFHQQIIQAGMTPESYMRAILKNAKANGYGEYTADIEFSDDDVHKLMIKTEIDGRSRTERFGRVGYGDFVLWNHSNPEKAQSKKDTFHRSHEAIKGKWRSDPLSPNNLSLHILW